MKDMEDMKDMKEMKMLEVILVNGVKFNVKAREVYYNTFERPADPVILFRNSYDDVRASVRDSDLMCWRVL